MAGFIRRFGFFPGTEVITQIEGVVVVDLPPPGAVEGVSTGVACLVGEFADMSFAVTVDGTGAVSSRSKPTQIFSAQDLANKTGGFDATLGDFGDSGGSGFVALRSKRFSSLIVAPVNLASDFACRFTRELPLCTSQVSTLPVVPINGGTITAGREFRNSTNGRIKTGTAVQFTTLNVIDAQLGGQTLAGGSAVTQTFESGNTAGQVWQVDVTGAPDFVDMTTEFNDDTDADYVPFFATEAAGDYAAWGLASTFGRLKFDGANGTAGVGGTGTWEYWNGSAWTALVNVVDGTAGFTTAVADGQEVTFDIPTDWAAQVLNASASLFYVRFVLTGVYATNPIYDQGFAGGIDWAAIVRPDGGQGAKKGDILVIGNNNAGARQPSAEARTYRVQATPTTGTTIVLEERNAAAFVWTANNTVPWRLHVSSDADSAPVVVLGATVAGGYNASEAGGSSVPMRPITDAVGAATDGVWPTAQTLNPLLIPPLLTGSTADPLSGLDGRTHPTQTLAFTASVQAPNAVASATLDVLYTTALASTISDAAPLSTINLIWCARTSSTIRNTLKQNVLSGSAVAAGRECVVSPELDTVDTVTATQDLSPGVGATRNERVVYSWPGVQMFVAEAVGTRLKTADGLTTIDGMLDVKFDSWLVSIMSNLPPERNPGQAQEPVPTVLAAVLDFQRGLTVNLEMSDYIAMRSRGVAGFRLDKTVGPILQSGITSSLISGEKNIARRRMADLIQDSVSARLVQYAKLPNTQANRDTATGEVEAYLAGLQSINNAAAQRIESYVVDDVSGNTPESLAKGIFVIIGRVRTIASMDNIVFQAEIGAGVVTTSDA